MHLRSILCCALAALVLAFSLPPVSATAQSAPPVAKTPIPDAAAVKSATKLVDDVYGSDIAAAKSPAQKLAIAQKMLDATKEEKDPTTLYILFTKVVTLASAAADLPSTFLVIDRIDQDFAIDSLKFKADSAAYAVKAATSPDQYSNQIPLLTALVESAVSAERFDIARSSSLLLAEASRGSKDPDQLPLAETCLAQVRATQQAFEENKNALAILAKNPTDPDANLKVGTYRCLYKGDWQTGLPMLARSSDEAFKIPAQTEVNGVAAVDDQIKLADAWWDLSEKANPHAKKQLQAHAASWYQTALPNLSGLNKARIQKRLANAPANDAAKRPAPDESKTVSIMNKLIPDNAAVVKKVDDGMTLTCAKGNASTSVYTEQEFKSPLVITLVAKTDTTNLRIRYGKGRMILNPEQSPTELHLEDPISGKAITIAGKGAIPKNTFVTIRWTLDERECRIQIDGVDGAVLSGDYSGISGQIKVGTDFGPRITIKSLDLTSATGKSSITRTGSNPGLVIPLTPIASTPKINPKPDNTTAKTSESPQNTTPQNPAKTPNDLQIVEAKWGAGGSQLDVTAKLQQLVKGSSLRFTVSNDLLTDPARNQHKTLVIVYLVAGEKISASYIEGDNVELSSAPNSFDPNVIERPEFAKAAKPIVKNLSSINSMIVRLSKDGDTLGLTTDIIASVPPDTRKSRDSGASLTTQKIGEDMRTSFAEAVRAVKLRYPTWTGGRIDVSFGEKYTEHDGGSAGAAFGLLLLSSLEGFDIDPKIAITGDITVDWKVRKVGGVASKIRGAIVDKFAYAAIPAANEDIIGDLPLLHGDSSLWDIQILSISTLQQAVATTRKDRSPELTEALKLFAELQSKLAKSNRLALRDAENIATLKRVLELAPNHLSAKALLAIADNTAPKNLSSAASLYRLSIILYPYLDLINNRVPLDRKSLPASTTANARKQITQLRAIASKDILPLVADLSALIEVAEESVARKSTATAFEKSRENLISRLATISANKELLEKLVRQGF